MIVAAVLLEKPGRATANAFAQVAGLLSDVRNVVASLGDRLRDLDEVVADQRGSALVLGGIEASALELREALNNALRVADADRVQRASENALNALEEIGKRTGELRAVSTLTLVTARSLHVEVFDDYVRNLRSLVAALSDEARQLRDGVLALSDRRRCASRHYAEAVRSLTGVTGVLEAVAAERARTDRIFLASLARISALAETLPSVAGAETTSLVSAMQFADSVAQRLDHIGQIMARQAASGPSAGALAGAQLRALVADIRTTALGIERSLGKIAAMAGDAGQVLTGDRSSEGGGPATSAIVLGRRILEQTASGTAGALAAIERAARESGDLEVLAREASDRFSRVTTATEVIHLAAINAALLARRDDGQERALTVLSVEVQQQATACSRVSRSCSEAVALLSNQDDLDAFAAVTSEAETFRRLVADTSAAVDAAGRALERIGALGDAAIDALDLLTASVNAAHTALGAIVGAVSGLAALADRLPDRPSPDSGPLLDIMDLYTMEEERAVHRHLFGIESPSGMSSAPAKATAHDDPLAAILF
jgi:hypothetical protein